MLKISTRSGRGFRWSAPSWRSALTLAMSASLFMGRLSSPAFAQSSAAWPQWGQNPQHTGFLAVAGQALQGKLSGQIFDPFTAQEMAESRGALRMHYQHR